LAFDAQGNLYVTNLSGGPNGQGTVSVFAPGSTTPTATLPGLNTPWALAVDANGDVFVANTGFEGDLGTTVSKFGPDGTLTATLTPGLAPPAAWALPARGTLSVATLGNSRVSEFPPARPMAGGVVVRTAQPAQPISVGAAPGAGLALSNAELAQIVTTAAGAV